MYIRHRSFYPGMPGEFACQNNVAVVLLREVRDCIVPEAMRRQPVELLRHAAIGQAVGFIHLELPYRLSEEVAGIVLVHMGVWILLRVGLRPE